MLVYGKYEFFRHADVCLCLVCILWQFSMLHDLWFINSSRGCKRRLYGRGDYMEEATIWKRHTLEPVS